MLLPRRQRILHDSMALIQALAEIVPILPDEPHILQHLLLDKVRPRNAGLERVKLDLLEARCFPSLGEELPERLQNLRRGRVARCTQYLLSKNAVSVQDHALDEIARVSRRVEERDGLIGREGEAQWPRAVLGVEHAAGEVAHKEAGQEEGGGNANGADVFLDLGLGVEVIDVGEGAVCALRDVGEGAPDEVVDTRFLWGMSVTTKE